MLASGRVVDRVAANAEKTAVNFRMQRLHAAVHHFGKAGQLGNVLDRQTGRLERRCRAASRDKLDTAGIESGGKGNEPGLVGDGQKSSAYLLVGHVYPSVFAVAVITVRLARPSRVSANARLCRANIGEPKFRRRSVSRRGRSSGFPSRQRLYRAARSACSAGARRCQRKRGFLRSTAQCCRRRRTARSGHREG